MEDWRREEINNISFYISKFNDGKENWQSCEQGIRTTNGFPFDITDITTYGYDFDKAKEDLHEILQLYVKKMNQLLIDFENDNLPIINHNYYRDNDD